MKTQTLLPAILFAIVATSCDKVQSFFEDKTISGEFRSEVRGTGETGITVGSGQFWDFRSDGTVTCKNSITLGEHETVVMATGTYKIADKKISVQWSKSTSAYETLTNPGGETLSLEGNGDLITSTGVRLKKQ